jgi:hypothetical protein
MPFNSFGIERERSSLWPDSGSANDWVREREPAERNTSLEPGRVGRKEQLLPPNVLQAP